MNYFIDMRNRERILELQRRTKSRIKLEVQRHVGRREQVVEDTLGLSRERLVKNLKLFHSGLLDRHKKQGEDPRSYSDEQRVG